MENQPGRHGNPHTLKPMDADAIVRAARETGAIVTAEHIAERALELVSARRRGQNR